MASLPKRPGAPSILPCSLNLSGLAPPQVLNGNRGTFAGNVTAHEDQIHLSPDPFTWMAMRGLRMRQDIATLLVNWDIGVGHLSYRFGHLDKWSNLEQTGDYTNFAGPPGFVLSLSAFKVPNFTNRTFDHELKDDRRLGALNVMVGGQAFTETSAVINSAQFGLRNLASSVGGSPFFLSTDPAPDYPFALATNRKN